MENSHSDSVLSLGLNPFQNEYLASGSADHTVKVWDLDEEVCKVTYASLHSNKVQVVKWNLKNESILMSAGYDNVVNIIDVRIQD